MKLLVYLVGEPGAGKTTLMRAVTADRERIAAAAAPVCAHMILRPPPAGSVDGMPAQMIELGRDRDTFGGTDALSMSIQPKAVAFMADADGLVLAEGDRLANDRFLTACEDGGWAVRVVALATPPRLAAARRKERDGGHQDPTWVTGRRTKAQRLAGRWGATVLDGTRPVADLADELRRIITGWAQDDLATHRYDTATGRWIRDQDQPVEKTVRNP